MKINYVLVLDKSGSMSAVKELTKKAIKQYLDAIKDAVAQKNIEAYATVMLFDSGTTNPFEYFYKITPVQDIDYSIIDSYSPNGGTPIYDAIAKAVIDLQKSLGDELGDENMNVLVNIYSDGEENSSVLFDAYKIKSMIETLQESRWTFTFQCAGAEKSIKEFAKSISIAEKNVQAYEATKEGFENSYATLTSSIGKYTDSVSRREEPTEIF